MRRSNKKLLEEVKAKRAEEDNKAPIKLDLATLDKITSNSHYPHDVVTTAAQFLARKHGIEEDTHLHVLSGDCVNQLKKILKDSKRPNHYLKPSFFLLELQTSNSERRWTTLVIKNGDSWVEGEELIQIIYKDATGGHADEVVSVLSKAFSEKGFNCVENLEGTCRPTDSGVLSLKWMEVIMEGLRSSDHQKFISEYTSIVLESSERVGRLKTDLKVDLVASTIRTMLSEVEVNEEIRTGFRKCIALTKKVREQLGVKGNNPVTEYEKLLKEEISKFEENSDYKMDEEAIMKAQKEMLEKLGKEDTAGMEELIKGAFPEDQCFPDETAEESTAAGEKATGDDNEEDNKDKEPKKKTPVVVFRECVRLLRGTEETEKLRELLNCIEDKFGLERNSLLEYFQALSSAAPEKKEDEQPDSGESMHNLESKLPPFSKAQSRAPGQNLKTSIQLLAEFAEEKELNSSEVPEAERENYFRQKYIGNKGVVQMEQDFNAVMEHFENWKNADIHRIHSWAIGIKGHLESYLEGIAVMDRVFQLTTGGNRLRASQIFSVIWFLRDSEAGKLAQISTGEGKTTIIAVVASIKALQQGVVDILTSNEVLAQEGVDSMKHFYQILGITVATNNSEKPLKNAFNESEPKPRKCYSADVVYGTITSFQFDYLRHTSEAMLTRGKRRFDYVILDEVDNLSVDNGGNIAKLAKPFPGMECLKYVYIKIWQELAKAEKTIAEEYSKKLEEKAKELEGKEGQTIGGYDKNEMEDFRVELISKYIDDVKKHIKASNPCEIDLVHLHLKSYCKSMLDSWIDNALFAKFECRENEMYVIKKVKGEEVVVPVDYANTGVTMQNTQWSNGLHQFVQLKHNLRLTCESLTSSFISNIGYIKLYQSKNIFGLTGTLGSTAEKEMLQAAYNVDFKVIPRYKNYNLMMCEGQVVLDQEWVNLVSLSAVIEAATRKRAVLVICKTISDLNIIRKNVEACLKLENYEQGVVKVKTYVDEDGSVVVKETLGQREIIIATNIAGRGTNFTTTPELEQVGGLHVIVSFLPYNQRVQDQAFGRTARQGNQGTAQLILKKRDIVEIGLEGDEENLTMQKILETRDQLERERLANIKEQKLSEIIFNDNLFGKFSTLFTDFKAKHAQTIGASYVAADLKEYWAFWLHKQDFTFKKIKSTSVDAEFNKFKSEAREQLENCTIMWNPFNEIRRAELFLQNGRLEDAEKAVRRGIQICGCDDLCASGYFKLFEIEIEKGAQLMERFKKALASLIFITLKKDEAYKVKAKEALEKAVAALEKEVNYINSNFFDGKSNQDFLLILTNGDNVMVNHLKGRLTALSSFHQHAKSLLERLGESVDSDTVGVAMGSRIPHYLKKLDDSSTEQKELKAALTSEELDELQATGLETVYALRDVHDAHKGTIIAAQAQIASGLACLAGGIIFPPAMFILGPIAGALISEGVCDIAIELLSRGQTGFDVKSYVKGKCISFGIALATMGISAVTSSVKMMDKAAKACKGLANLLRKCPYLKGVCQKLATQLDKLGKFFDKLKLIAQFNKLKDMGKLEMLQKLKAAGEVEKLKHLGGLEKVRQLEHLKSVGRLDVISRTQLLKSVAVSIGKQTVQSVSMSLISEHLVTAGLNRILEGLKPSIETRVREGIAKENIRDKLATLKGRKEVESLVMSVLEGTYGEMASEVLKEIALGVVRHSSNWKLKLTSLALDTALSLTNICKYTCAFCQRFKGATVAKESEEEKGDSSTLAEKEDVVVSLVTDKVYGLVMQLTGKYANTLVVGPLMSKVFGQGKKKKQEVSEDDEQTLAQITDAFETLGLSPGATLEEVKKAHRKGAFGTHPDRRGGDSAKFMKVQQSYELIKKLHEDLSTFRSEQADIKTSGARLMLPGPPGLIYPSSPSSSGSEAKIAPERTPSDEPGDGGKIATISAKLEHTIVVKLVDKNNELVNEIEYGSEFKGNGKPVAVIGYVSPTRSSNGIGHFFEMSSLNSLVPFPATGNNCLYDCLAPQIHGGILSPQQLRIIGESPSLVNIKHAIANIAVQPLNNPITQKLYLKARAALLVGGSIATARDARDGYVAALKGMNLPTPKVTPKITLLEACKEDTKAISAIQEHSSALVKDGQLKSYKDPATVEISHYKITGVDTLTSFILNFKHSGKDDLPFMLEFPNGVRCVFAGNLYSLVAYKGDGGSQVHVADSQYHGQNLGTIYNGLLALTHPDHQLGMSQYSEVTGRLISEAIRNKATLVSTCLAMNCDTTSPIAGSFENFNGGLYVTFSTGIIWEESDVVHHKNPTHLLDRHYERANNDKDVKNIFAKCVRTIAGEENKSVTVGHILRQMTPDQRTRTQTLFYQKLYENYRNLLYQGDPPFPLDPK